ncbi:MAG: cytidine deaminase [Lachnospiraceae bacterium]
MLTKDLVLKAIEAQHFSYSPYSSFQVGACLLAKDGQIFTGCNIENAAYSPTNCAERTAFFKAVSQGVLEFESIAIVGSLKDCKDEERNYCPPCGVCLQVMTEFCNPNTFKVILVKNENDYKEHLLKDMIPFSFTSEDL